jgi:hypothetical protein
MSVLNPIPDKQEHGSWLKVAGKPADALAAELELLVRKKIESGKFRSEDVEYIERINRQLVKGTLALSDSKLEKLRRLCQLWEIEVKSGEISSHRKVVGPFIVAFKKVLFPIVKVLLKDTLRQQRDFNAAAIALLTELSQEDSGRDASPKRPRS